jgi:hypothetical protein
VLEGKNFSRNFIVAERKMRFFNLQLWGVTTVTSSLGAAARVFNLFGINIISEDT